MIFLEAATNEKLKSFSQMISESIILSSKTRFSSVFFLLMIVILAIFAC
jgi:hypothetical protein